MHPSRTPLVIANWKMNKTPSEAAVFCDDFLSRLPALPERVELAIAPAFPALERVGRHLLPTRVKLGAQDVHVEPKGAHTGEVSVAMLADVGVAMGTGADVAVESAGVTLIKGDLQGVARARLLSEAVMRNIKQNLFFAFIYNAIGVPVAAGVLYPFFGILLSPIIAAAAMSLSSVSVIGNALRLRASRF